MFRIFVFMVIQFFLVNRSDAQFYVTAVSGCKMNQSYLTYYSGGSSTQLFDSHQSLAIRYGGGIGFLFENSKSAIETGFRLDSEAVKFVHGKYDPVYFTKKSLYSYKHNFPSLKIPLSFIYYLRDKNSRQSFFFELGINYTYLFNTILTTEGSGAFSFKSDNGREWKVEYLYILDNVIQNSIQLNAAFGYLFQVNSNVNIFAKIGFESGLRPLVTFVELWHVYGDQMEEFENSSVFMTKGDNIGLDIGFSYRLR